MNYKMEHFNVRNVKKALLHIKNGKKEKYILKAILLMIGYFMKVPRLSKIIIFLII